MSRRSQQARQNEIVLNRVWVGSGSLANSDSTTHKAMSKVNPPQGEQTTQHPLKAVIEELDSLLEKLRMELDVAPTDRKAHQDLLRRIIRASERGLQIPTETYPKHPNLAVAEIHKPTEEDLELLESVEWITEGEIGEEIDVDAINQRLQERGYKIQLSFPETPEH